MWKWLLAAVAVPVLSLGISFAYSQLPDTSHPWDPAAYELNRQIQLQYEPVPLVRLLANPERYDGHKVNVGGFVTLEFEGSALHLDKASYEASLLKNAVWIEAPEWVKSARKAAPVDRRYGKVAGVFVAGRNGHFGQYSGSLTEVRSIAPTFTRSDYQAWRLTESRRAFMQQLFSGSYLSLVGWLLLAMLWLFSRRPKGS